MDDERLKLNRPAIRAVPARDADLLLEAGDGDGALLYLYLVKNGGALDIDLAAHELRLSVRAVRLIAQRLERLGLLASGVQEALPDPTPPEYQAADVVRRSQSDPAFQALLAETRRVLGHDLSTPDLNTLFGIYDRLGMPSEVIMLMINHCAARLRRRYGEGRLPTMHAVEKEAFQWARQEIFTVTQAEEFIAQAERMEEEGQRLRRMLQITDRAPTATERKYMESWLSMGFGCDALALAYDRTVVSTGKLTWAYMDRIVRSWYEKGLFTPEDIEKGDTRPGGRKSAASPKPEDQTARTGRGDDADRLRDLLNIKE